MSWLTPMRGSDTVTPEIEFADCTSHGLPFITRELRERTDCRVLDLGPVCGENISFFGQRAEKLFVYDIFLTLDKSRRKGSTEIKTLDTLDYPSRQFDLILLWDLMDRLVDEEVKRLVEYCHRMAKPKGILSLFSSDVKENSPAVNSFVINEGFQISLRCQSHLSLKKYKRELRDLINLMHPFLLRKSFLYRNGIREFIFYPE